MNNITLSSSSSSYPAAAFSAIATRTTNPEDEIMVRQNPNLSSRIKSSTSFEDKIIEVIVAYLKEREMPFCSICLEPITIPLRFPCGHWFDLDCMAEQMHRGQPKITCPIDKSSLQRTKASLNSDSLPENEMTQVQFFNDYFTLTVPVRLDTKISRLDNLICFFLKRKPQGEEQTPIDPLSALQSEKFYLPETTITMEDLDSKPVSGGKTLKELGFVANKTTGIVIAKNPSAPQSALKIIFDNLNLFKAIGNLFSSLFPSKRL